LQNVVFVNVFGKQCKKK